MVFLAYAAGGLPPKTYDSSALRVAAPTSRMKTWIGPGVPPTSVQSVTSPRKILASWSFVAVGVTNGTLPPQLVARIAIRPSRRAAGLNSRRITTQPVLPRRSSLSPVRVTCLPQGQQERPGPLGIGLGRRMEPVRGGHVLPHLLAHEREDVDVRAACALDLLARDLVEALDRARGARGIAEGRAARCERPVRLRQTEARRRGRAGAHTLVDAAQLRSIPLLGDSGADVVRADEDGDEVGPVRLDQRQLLANEVVGRVAVHRRVAQVTFPALVPPAIHEDGGERPIRRGAGADGERVAQG